MPDVRPRRALRDSGVEPEGESNVIGVCYAVFEGDGAFRAL